jgi:hypothetical protein
MANPPVEFRAIKPIDYPSGSGPLGGWAFQPGDPVHRDYEAEHGLLAKGLVEEVAPPEEEVLAPKATARYDDLTVVELDEVLRERGLSTVGNKADKVGRLADDDDPEDDNTL